MSEPHLFIAEMKLKENKSIGTPAGCSLTWRAPLSGQTRREIEFHPSLSPLPHPLSHLADAFASLATVATSPQHIWPGSFLMN